MAEAAGLSVATAATDSYSRMHPRLESSRLPSNYGGMVFSSGIEYGADIDQPPGKRRQLDGLKPGLIAARQANGLRRPDGTTLKRLLGADSAQKSKKGELLGGRTNPGLLRQNESSPTNNDPSFPQVSAWKERHIGRPQRDAKEKHTVSHACVYCRRSHMTCDDNRPCKRCIKRNLGHLCHDEPRNRPKSSSSEYDPSKTVPPQRQTIQQHMAELQQQQQQQQQQQRNPPSPYNELGRHQVGQQMWQGSYAGGAPSYHDSASLQQTANVWQPLRESIRQLREESGQHSSSNESAAYQASLEVVFPAPQITNKIRQQNPNMSDIKAQELASQNPQIWQQQANQGGRRVRHEVRGRRRLDGHSVKSTFGSSTPQPLLPQIHALRSVKYTISEDLSDDRALSRAKLCALLGHRSWEVRKSPSNGFGLSKDRLIAFRDSTQVEQNNTGSSGIDIMVPPENGRDRYGTLSNGPGFHDQLSALSHHREVHGRLPDENNDFLSLASVGF